MSLYSGRPVVSHSFQGIEAAKKFFSENPNSTLYIAELKVDSKVSPA